MNKIKDAAAAILMLMVLLILFVGTAYGVAMFYQGSLI